jgi:hypothetical protein
VRGILAKLLLEILVSEELLCQGEDRLDTQIGLNIPAGDVLRVCCVLWYPTKNVVFYEL